jgi:polyribonucleotide nucleotidyltransferase
MHHYNFPPYSVGETGRMGGINRREMGHGFLAEKALTPVIPDKMTFPYTIRLVSECMASNGSTSQASICAGTLALMDGGVPIKAPVAGIAIGLMMDEKDETKYKLLTDIQGPEDHHGDMDFKIGGTKNGVTALQLDIKLAGVPVAILKDALEKGRLARLHILETITQEIPESRKTISPSAPQIIVTQISPEKIGLVIGGGGKTVKNIKEVTGAEVNIEDDGTIYITGKDGSAEKAKSMIESLTHEFKVGEEYDGEVVKIIEVGAIVKLNEHTDGMVHISEIAPFRVMKVDDVLKVGMKVPVKVMTVDKEKGRVGLSIKARDKDFVKNPYGNVHTEPKA